MAGDSQPSRMGSPKDGNAPARLPNSKPAAAAIASASSPEASPSAMPENSAHLAASAQTYYRTAGTQPAFFLPIWGGQHLVPLCGNPPIFSSMYDSSAVYMHPFINPGMGYLAGQSMKSKGAPDDFVGGSEISCSREEDASQRNMSINGGAKINPYESRDESPGPQDHFKKRNFKELNQECASSDKNGESSQLTHNTDESTFTGRGRAPKLPVLVPRRIRMPATGDDMDIWSVGRSTVEAGFYEAMPDHYCIQDEHKLKRERRKLHNRESLIRSRLRNLQKTEELARKVAKLRGENAELRIELEQLHKVCKDIEAENQHISEKINNICEKSSSSS